MLVDSEFDEATLPKARASEVADASEWSLGGEEEFGFSEHDLRKGVVNVEGEAELGDADCGAVKEVSEVLLTKNDVVRATKTERGYLGILEEKLDILFLDDVGHKEMNVRKLFVSDVCFGCGVASNHVIGGLAFEYQTVSVDLEGSIVVLSSRESLENSVNYGILAGGLALIVVVAQSGGSTSCSNDGCF